MDDEDAKGDLDDFKILDDSIVQDRMGGRGLFRSQATGGAFADKRGRRFSAVSFKPSVSFAMPNDQEKVKAIVQKQARQSIMSKEEKISVHTQRRSSVSQYNAKPKRRHSTIVYKEDEGNFMIQLLRAYHASAADSSDQPQLYTDKALLQRESLRFDPKIVNILSEIWAWVDINKDGSVDVVEYSRIYKVLGKVLWGKKRPDDAALETMAEEEFRSDTGGTMEMKREDFFRSFFQLADTWTDRVDSKAYVAFLAKILAHIKEMRNKAKEKFGGKAKMLIGLAKLKKKSISELTEELIGEQADPPESTPPPQAIEKIDTKQRDAEEKARREKEAEERSRREEQERLRKESVKDAEREAREKARREEQEKKLREAEERAKRVAEEEAKREAESEERKRKEAEKQAKIDAEKRAKREAREKARLEAEANAKREAEEKARRLAAEEAEREKIRRAAEEKEKLAAEAKAKAAAELKAKRDAERLAKEKAEADAKRQIEQEARRVADEKARLEAAERAKIEAAARAVRLAEDEKRREAAEEARLKAEEEARRLALLRERQDADEAARRAAWEATEKARQAAVQKRLRDAQDKDLQRKLEIARRKAEQHNEWRAKYEATQNAAGLAAAIAREAAASARLAAIAATVFLAALRRAAASAVARAAARAASSAAARSSVAVLEVNIAKRTQHDARAKAAGEAAATIAARAFIAALAALEKAEKKIRQSRFDDRLDGIEQIDLEEEERGPNWAWGWTDKGQTIREEDGARGPIVLANAQAYQSPPRHIRKAFAFEQALTSTPMEENSLDKRGASFYLMPQYQNQQQLNPGPFQQSNTDTSVFDIRFQTSHGSRHMQCVVPRQTSSRNSQITQTRSKRRTETRKRFPGQFLTHNGGINASKPVRRLKVPNQMGEELVNRVRSTGWAPCLPQQPPKRKGFVRKQVWEKASYACQQST